MLVLSGGFGTRLKSVLKQTPKTLAPVEDTTFLELQLKSWIKAGYDDFLFLLYYGADQIINALDEISCGIPGSIKLSYVIEPEPLGTGGAVANAVHECNIKDDFFVINADTWLGDGPAAMVSAQSPSIGVLEVEDTSRYGAVKVNDKNIITGFSEKTKSGGSGLINAGLYKLHPDHISGVTDSVFSMEKVVLPKLCEAGILKAVRLKDEFVDIGVPEDYYRFVQKYQLSKP